MHLQQIITIEPDLKLHQASLSLRRGMWRVAPLRCSIVCPAPMHRLYPTTGLVVVFSLLARNYSSAAVIRDISVGDVFG